MTPQPASLTRDEPVDSLADRWLPGSLPMFGGISRKELARAMALSQIGMLMAVPAGAGLLLDKWLNWSPWGVITGAVLGLTFGLIQLVRLSSQSDDKPDSKDQSK